MAHRNQMADQKSESGSVIAHDCGESGVLDGAADQDGRYFATQHSCGWREVQSGVGNDQPINPPIEESLRRRFGAKRLIAVRADQQHVSAFAQGVLGTGEDGMNEGADEVG
jgi:hypothetical protein